LTGGLNKGKAIIMNSNSQSRHISAAFRFNVDSVQIDRNAAGELVLRPAVVVQAGSRGQALMQALQGFDDDFISALSEQSSFHR
jgi:antitoxin VapB